MFDFGLKPETKISQYFPFEQPNNPLGADTRSVGSLTAEVDTQIYLPVKIDKNGFITFWKSAP